MRRPGHRTRGQRGSATALAMPLVGVLLVAGVLLAPVGGVVVAQRRAQAAADLGALAGAVAVQQGHDVCADVAHVVDLNRARMRSCAVEGRDVLVRVELRLEVPGGRALTVHADARAGPGAGTPLPGGLPPA